MGIDLLDKKYLLNFVYLKYHSISRINGGAEDFDIYCEICDRADIRLPAIGYCVDCEEHLCQSCFNTHRLPRPLCHHQLLDKDHMPQQQKLHRSSKFTSSPQTGDLTKPCTKHTKEVIKFYCHDHNALICSVCVTLEHTPTSCHVDYIPDISGQALDSTEFKEALKDIDKLINKCSQMTSDLKQIVAKSTTSLNDAIAEIDKFRKEINKRLDELEKEVKDTAITIQLDNNKKMKTTETTCDNINKSLQASADTLKHLNINKKTDQLFAELKIAQQLIQDNNNIISQLQTINDIDEYIFEPNQGIKKVLQDEKSLGTLSSKKKKHTAEPKNPTIVGMKLSTPIKYINAKSSSDKNSLSLKNKLKVDGECNGISHHQGKLAVTYIKPGKLQVMNLKGNAKITVDKDSNGGNIFSHP
ncbi:E3 ubiquitin-protein ligase TRIM33-like, partial [Ruditapes philippinarum]|uniref:E3 ubiquitin-protein ligase TRIM33-like n=1 Tax=Ruditapes philippinarum TaxID=129788 RepID=UPI00295BCF74